MSSSSLPDQAAQLFGDALDLIGDKDRVARCEAMIGLGESQRLTGDRAFARRCSRHRRSPRGSSTGPLELCAANNQVAIWLMLAA